MTVQTWNHSRKGRITGTVITESDEWLDIQLATDHDLQAVATSNRGITEAGEVITVRRSLLREVLPTPAPAMTPEEIQAMPYGTKFYDVDNDVVTRQGSGLFYEEVGLFVRAESAVRLYGPITLEPKPKDPSLQDRLEHTREALVQVWASDPEGRQLVQDILDRKVTEPREI